MFAAIISRASRTPPLGFASGDDLLAALFPFTQPDVSGVWSDERALISHGVIHNTPESRHERAPEICAETGRVIVSWVRLDNRESLCAQLGLGHRRELTDPQIILAAHREWGRDCAAKLEGDFSFVIYDPATGETYCARDAIGAKPFYYFLSDEVFVAATSIAAIKAVRGLDLTPDITWSALFLANMAFAHDQGAYEGVRKLPPAHHLTIATDSFSGPQEYFKFDLEAPHATARDAKWVEQYRDSFDLAVAVRARSAFLVGADSSGGLDSASIVASLVRSLPHSLDDFHVFAMLAMEREPKLVEAVSEMCGVRHTHTLVKPELLRIDDSFECALTVMGHPPEHGQMLIYPEFFEICRRVGIRTIQSGFGGDEVVTSYANHLIDELHHRGEYAAVFAAMHGTLPRRMGRFAKRILRGPDDPDIRAKHLMEMKLSNSCIRQDFLEDTGLGRRIAGYFLPERKEFSLNTIATNEPGFRYARAARLESSAICAAAHGVEYRFPMLDRTLIQQFFATPSIEKRNQDMGRYLHRRAMEGRIPAAIQWQKSKYVGDFIDGKPLQETPPAMSFADLPVMVRDIIDQHAFESVVKTFRQNPDDYENTSHQRRFFVWQLRQLSAWLSA